MFRGFDDDPFFREFNDGMRQRHGDMLGGMMGGGDMFRDMDNMMNNMMRGFRSDMGMIEGPRGGEGGRSDRQRDRQSDRQVAERPSMRSFFPDMSSLGRQMDEMARDGNVHSFSSQQVYSYRNDGSGEPQEYQAISTTATAPGGVKETKKGYKDSSTKTQKMQYGRYLGDRSTIQERSQVRDQREEKTDYNGFTESEAPEFDKEWGSKAGSLYRPSMGNEPGRSSKNREVDGPRNKHKALPAPRRRKDE